jgi:hypothetical protein
MKAYIAGSLRNKHGLDAVFTAVREAGIEITIDYREGEGTPEAIFGPNHRNLTPAEHIAALARPPRVRSSGSIGTPSIGATSSYWFRRAPDDPRTSRRASPSAWASR